MTSRCMWYTYWKTSAPIGIYDGPTNQQTGMRVHREVTLPMAAETLTYAENVSGEKDLHNEKLTQDGWTYTSIDSFLNMVIKHF